MKLRVKTLYRDAGLPKYATTGSAGLDLCAMNMAVIDPWSTALIHTGLSVEIPDGYYGALYVRSSVARTGLVLTTGTSVIDSDYRGEVLIELRNVSKSIHIVNPGDRIAQLVFQPYERVEVVEADELNDTDRGSGGFGSTGS